MLPLSLLLLLLLLLVVVLLLSYNDDDERERALAVVAPRLWNSIPLELRSSSSIDIFKQHLKTYLFKQAF